MIIWVVNKVDFRLASFRYRALWMARAASLQGTKCIVTDDIEFVRGAFSKNVDAIIFSKSFNDNSFDLAWAAKKAEIPIVIDLCDNIFVPNYLGEIKGYKILGRFYAMQHIADMVVVPTEELKQEIAQNIGNQQSIQVVPDGIETSDDITEMILKVDLCNDHEIPLNDHLTIVKRCNNKKRRSLIQKLAVIKRRTPSACKVILKAVTGRYNAIQKYDFIDRINYAVKNPDKIIPYLKRRLGWEKHLLSKAIAAPNRNTKSVTDKSDGNCKKIIWFGNAGNASGDYGIATVAHQAEALIKINQEVPVKLIIVSNNRSLFNEYIEPLPINTDYVAWDPVTIFRELKSADVCIVPNSGDYFSKTKSANRVILSLVCGTPVVADDFSSLAHLRDSIVVGDWDRGLRRYLVDNNQEQDLANAREVISNFYSDDIIGNQWQQIFDGLKEKDERLKPTILVVLDLIQDLEIMKPILRHLNNRSPFRVKVLVTRWLVARSPRVLTFLNELGTIVVVKDRDSIIQGDSDYLINVDTILLPTETNLNPHRVSHHIANQAKDKIKTVTFQHGLENVGLSYFDAHKVSFASDMIITWNDHIQDNPKIDDRTRDRCIPLGMFKEISHGMTAQQLQEKVGFEKIVGVFENLHWDRYDDHYREEFLKSIVSIANRYPDICLLIKPHHAGVWLNKVIANEKLSDVWPQNIYVIDVADIFWEKYTGNQIVGACDAVITTPSTIAVDSSLCGVPVAIVANNLEDLASFGPLTSLHDISDWIVFIDRVLDGDSDVNENVSRFRNRTIKSLNPLEEFDQLVLRR